MKALFDLMLAFALLVLAAPIIFIACLVVKLTSRGPVIYAQTRMGRSGKLYTLYKIRTMTHDCERDSGICWAKKNDPRITGVGRFLRRMHIDELPQLWNVVRGDMSLVGPRPERPEFLPGLVHQVPRYRERLLVRPGLTGLAQIQLPADTDVASVRRKLAYDVFYIERLSIWLDCRILVSTALYVCGVPVSTFRSLLGVPHGEPVEQAFEKVDLPVAPVPELKPA